MRVLFDQGVPVTLRHRLPGHHVAAAFENGWATLTNGELLSRAESAGFDVLVTTDQSLRFQQNLAARRIAVIVIGTTSWRRIQVNTALVARAVDSAAPGTCIELPMP